MSGNDLSIDPRVKRTRQLLQQAFMSLVQEKEFNKITVQDITERAEVNRATFYAHFEDKYALIDYCLREMFLEFVARRLPASAEFSVDHLRLLTLAVCEFMAAFSDHCKPRSFSGGPPIEAQVQACVYDVILGWMIALPHRQSLFAAQPESVANAISWTIFGSALKWAHGDRKNSAEQMADEVLPLILSGLNGLGVLAMTNS